MLFKKHCFDIFFPLKNIWPAKLSVCAGPLCLTLIYTMDYNHCVDLTLVPPSGRIKKDTVVSVIYKQTKIMHHSYILKIKAVQF